MNTHDTSPVMNDEIADRLIPAEERRPLSAAGHHELLDDETQVDPYAGDPPSRRSDKEISRVLSILDSLENSNVERASLNEHRRKAD